MKKMVAPPIIEGKLKSFSPSHFYHIAEPSNMTSIRRHGLLSTERLVTRVARSNAEIDAILGSHRDDSLILRDGVCIRDQRPMPPTLLKQVLCDGMTPSDWYRFLNGFVFLWANEDRLDRHLRAFAGRRQVVLTFDAKRLLADLGHRVFLSPINSGNARRNAVVRCRMLFTSYHDWLSKG